MRRKPLFGSLTRISDLESGGFEVRPVDRDAWSEADYVVVEVRDPGQQHRLEFPTGRLASYAAGDILVGALGVRYATLEATGDWRAVGADLKMQMLTGAGLLGRVTSVSAALGSLADVAYLGHAIRAGQPLSMRDFVPALEPVEYTTPSVLVIGTSMSAGKTTAARVIVRVLREAGLRVAGAKLTGAGRYRDILSMGDAGADPIVDFVDAGLPSSVCDEARFNEAARHLLTRVQTAGVDVAVIEAGASPLEPYNGEAAVAALGSNVRFRVLAASDPYAVLGVMEAFDVRPDLVTGIAANTHAGVALVERLTGCRALDVREPGAADTLQSMLVPTLEEEHA